MRSLQAVVRPWWTALALALVVSGCSRGDSEAILEQEEAELTIEVTSSAFTDGAPIPTKYTCEGEDVSPPLGWSGVPQGTRSIALISDDPDAPGGTWVHWVHYAIPSGVTELPEGVPGTETLPNGARQGINDFKRTGYGGPCPPKGHGPHRYYFKVYALDAEGDLKPGAGKKDLLGSMEGHILAEGRVMGTYERR